MEPDGPDRPLSAEGVNLDSYADLIEHLEHIEAYALRATPSIPPGDEPSPEHLEGIALRLERGA